MKRLKMQVAVLSLASVCCGFSVARAQDTMRQDKTFVMDSGEGSVAEIEMGKLALANSQNPDVRTFAEKMVHDHSMLIANMKPFADKMGVPPPTPAKLERAEKDEYERLSKKHGDAFDKDYITTMVDDHHKDLAEFTRERDTTANPELKATVAKGRGVIQEHTQMIEGMARKYNLPVSKTP